MKKKAIDKRKQDEFFTKEFAAMEAVSRTLNSDVKFVQTKPSFNLLRNTFWFQIIYSLLVGLDHVASSPRNHYKLLKN